MKYISYISLLICLLIMLVSCSNANTQKSVSDSKEDIASVAVYLERINYYRNIIEEYEDEIIDLKKEIYVSKYEYESRIEYLENIINNSESEKETLSPTRPNESTSGAVETDSVQVSTTPKSDDFKFIYTEASKTAIISGYTGSATVVTVPESIDGYKIVGIADKAFDKNTAVTEISLPKGIESIGWFAFRGCSSLQTVSIPDSVTAIGYGAFDACTSKLKILCSTDSYAHRYAVSYGLNVKG